MSIYWVDPWKDTEGDGTYNNPFTMFKNNTLYPDVIYDCDEFRIKSKLKSDLVVATVCATPYSTTETPKIQCWQLNDDICTYSNPTCFNQTLVVGEEGFVSTIGHNGSSYDSSTKVFSENYYYGAFPYQFTDWSRPVCIGIINYNCVQPIASTNTNGTFTLLGGVSKNICICNLGCRFTATDGWINETTRCIDKKALSIVSTCGTSSNVFGHYQNSSQTGGTIGFNHCIDLSNTTIFSVRESQLSLYLPDINNNLPTAEALQIAQNLENKIPTCESTVFKLKNFTTTSMYYYGAITLYMYNKFECYPNTVFGTHFLNTQKSLHKVVEFDYIQNGWNPFSNGEIRSSNNYNQNYDFCIKNLSYGITYGNNLSISKIDDDKLKTNLYIDSVLKYTQDSGSCSTISLNDNLKSYTSIHVDKFKFYTLITNDNKCKDFYTSFGMQLVSTQTNGDNNITSATDMYYPTHTNCFISLGNNSPVKNHITDIFSHISTPKEKYSIKRNHIFDPSIPKPKICRSPVDYILEGQLEINNSSSLTASINTNYVQVYDYNLDNSSNISNIISNINDTSVGNYYQNTHGRLNIIINQNYEYRNSLIFGAEPHMLLIGERDFSDIITDEYSIRFRSKDTINGLYFNKGSYGYDNKYIIAYNVPFNKGLNTIVTGNLKNRVPSLSGIYKIELVHNDNSVEQLDIGNSNNWNAFSIQFKSLSDQVGQFRIYIQGISDPNGYNQVDISLEGLGVKYEL